jgi:hypothetical protein
MIDEIFALDEFLVAHHHRYLLLNNSDYLEIQTLLNLSDY